MFSSTKVGGGRSGGLHGYDLFAPKLPVLSSPQEFFSRSERCGEAQCVAFFRAPRLFPFSSFSHSNAVFFFYSTHYPTDAQIILPHPHYLWVRALRCALRRKKHLIPDRVGLCVRRKHKRALSQYNTLYKILLNYTIWLFLPQLGHTHVRSFGLLCTIL